MFRKLVSRLMSRRERSLRGNKASTKSRICHFEALEDRRLLAADIRWVNELDPQSNDFIDTYGQSAAAIASQLVNRAIADWEAVVTDFNYDGDSNPATVNAQNNVFNLNIFALPIAERGATQNWAFSNGRPISADIELDDNGATETARGGTLTARQTTTRSSQLL